MTSGTLHPASFALSLMTVVSHSTHRHLTTKPPEVSETTISFKKEVDRVHRLSLREERLFSVTLSLLGIFIKATGLSEYDFRWGLCPIGNALTKTAASLSPPKHVCHLFRESSGCGSSRMRVGDPEGSVLRVDREALWFSVFSTSFKVLMLGRVL